MISVCGSIPITALADAALRDAAGGAHGLFCGTAEELMISELAERVDRPLSSGAREVHRLEDGGEAGNDNLDGGPGNDLIDGGLGTDACLGESGTACEGP